MKTMIVQLQSDMLLKPCTVEIPNFSINDKSNLPDELIDQKRAEEALKMGLKIKGNGFNVFASGDDGTGKLRAVKMFLEKMVANCKYPFSPTGQKLVN